MTDMHEQAEKLSRSAQPGALHLGSDLLHGAEAIAEFVFGDTKKRRRIYHLAETTPFPIFRLGTTLCARKSKLLAWIAAQEGDQPTVH